jgi:hypothetical protein
LDIAGFQTECLLNINVDFFLIPMEINIRIDVGRARENCIMRSSILYTRHGQTFADQELLILLTESRSPPYILFF